MKTKEAKTRNRGVTLIALVVTIIVLLILAGISISMLTGQNGILNRATEAKEKTEVAREDELRKLTQMEAATHLENQIYTDKNRDSATIPAGFAVSQLEGENTIEDGLVIMDKSGNEFVWIPVEKDTLYVKGTEKPIAEPTNGTDSNGNINYQGVLYEFIGEGENTNSTEMQEYGQDTKLFREPAFLEDSKWGDASDYNTAGITSSKLQEEYNEMIKSIKNFGGFYVARYEMGINKGMATSLKGILPTTAEESETYTWYGLYNMAKLYSSKSDSVTSTMIWGSQYDAMLNFALTGDDKSKLNATTNAKHNLESKIETGKTQNDKIINIFDLEGNLMEWTLESYDNMKRVRRGGVFNNYINASNRKEAGVWDNRNFEGTRISLFLK